jgi:hypothetical protein
MTTFLVRGGYIRVKSEINITRMEIPAVRFASPDRPCAAYAGACLVLTGEGSPYKLPQRNDAKDGPVRNFIAQALVIVGVRTAGDG